MKSGIAQCLWRLCPGSRRSFFCRMKSKMLPNLGNSSNTQIKEESDTSSSSRSSNKRRTKLPLEEKYRVIQCTGYLKSWTPLKEHDNDDTDNEDHVSTNLSCLVAIGRIPSNVLVNQTPTSLDNHPNIRHVNFLSRHSVDGKFLFIDQRYINMVFYCNLYRLDHFLIIWLVYPLGVV